MNSENLEHQRARHANSRVELRFGQATTQSNELKEYRAVALQSVASIRQSGLLQTVVFWLSKCSAKQDQGTGESTEGKRRTGEDWVLSDVLDWLVRECAMTRSICGSSQGGSPRSKPVKADLARPFEITEPLLARNSWEIALLESETLAYLGWLRRLVEGRWKALKKQGNKKETE